MQSDNNDINLCLRPDLTIICIKKNPFPAKYEIIIPKSGEKYEVDELTLNLLQLFDGASGIQDILKSFNIKFGTKRTAEEIKQFINDGLKAGLLIRTSERCVNDPQTSQSKNNSRDREDEESIWDEQEINREYYWKITEPANALLRLSKQAVIFKPLILTAVYAIIPGLILAFYTFYENTKLISKDLSHLGEPISYLYRLVFFLIIFSLLRCIIQGTLITYYGGQVRSFGIRLRFGLIPRFSIDKKSIRYLDKSSRLWAYGSNLLFRLIFVVGGTLVWFMFRGSGTNLAINAIIVTHAALITFIILSLPVHNADGYKWLMTYQNMPLSTLKLALLSFKARVLGKPQPPSNTLKKPWRLALIGLFLVIFWIFAFIRITSRISQGLIESFPGIFGEATNAIITSLIILIILRWILLRFGKFQKNSYSYKVSSEGHDIDAKHESLANFKPEESYGDKKFRILMTIITSSALFLPYPYRPGGDVVLLSPAQQVIQAPISGKVVDVSFRGGDGTLIQEGVVIARILSAELENQINVINEQIGAEHAELEKRRAVLAKIQIGPRKEEIDEAQAKKDRAVEELRMAELELETARVTFMHSEKLLESVKKIQKGMISELQIANMKKQADVDRLQIKEKEAYVEAKKRNLDVCDAGLAILKKGATEEEIEIARQEVVEAEASLRRYHQQLDFTQRQVESSQLTMPFEGYLVEGYLDTKIGTYFNKGGTYATAQAKYQQSVQMVIPEYDIADIEVGSDAEIKLLAYPTRPINGKVISIHPSGIDAVYGQVFNVDVALNGLDGLSLKPGMTGYGKILSGDKPLYELITRPVVRFISIEMWSWVL